MPVLPSFSAVLGAVFPDYRVIKASKIIKITGTCFLSNALNNAEDLNASPVPE